MKNFKPKKQVFQLFNRIHTSNFNLNLEKEVILNKIKVNASEILVYNKTAKLKDPESSKKVYAKLKETAELYFRIQDFENSKKFLDRVIEITIKNSGEKHINLIDLYEQSARNNLFLNNFDDCYNDLSEIISIKNAVKDLEIENLSFDTSKDEKAIHLLMFLITYFQNINLNEQNQIDLHLNDSTKSLEQIVEEFSVEKRFKVAKEILTSKLKEIDLGESDYQKENFQKYIIINRKLGSLHDEKGFKKEASEYYNEAYKYSKELYGKSSPISGMILVDISETLVNINKYESRDLAKEAIVIFSKLDKETIEENPHYEIKIAKAMKILGQIYLHMKPEESYSYLKNSSVITERLEGKENLNWIETSYSLMHSLDLLSKKRESEFLRKEIEEVVFKFESDNEIMAAYYENFGIHFLRNDQLIFANQFFEKSFHLYDKMKDILQREKMRLYMSLLLQKKGEKEKSAEMLNESISILKNENLDESIISKEIKQWSEILGDDILDSSDKDHELDQIHLKYLREFKFENFQKGTTFQSSTQENEAFELYLKQHTKDDKQYQKLVASYEPTNDVQEQVLAEAKRILSDKDELDKILDELKTDPEMMKILMQDEIEKDKTEFLDNLNLNRESMADMTREILTRRSKNAKKTVTKKKSLKKKK
eukprot:gene4301-7657_t